MLTVRAHRRNFNEAYVPYLGRDERIQIYFGGASSGKSYFLAQRTVLDAIQGRNILVLRNVARTMRGSVWNEIAKAIYKMKVNEYFRMSASEMLITSLVTGSQVMFAGLDDVDKIKSITPRQGVLTDIWIEEATEVSRDDYKQLQKRLRGLSPFSKRISMSFNPIYKEHWLYTEFFGGWQDGAMRYNGDDISIMKTTYRDNRFLTQEDRDALESESDEYYRAVYTDGEWGVLGDVIFRNWRVEDLSEFAKTADKLYFGLDFGFSSDPAAAVMIHYDRARRRVYVLDELYERGLTNDVLAGLLKDFAGDHYITCDSAEPKSIAELKRHGIRALPAVKGPDSVMHGIQWLQGHEIIVDTQCQRMKNELMLYQWRKDKDGRSLRAPENQHDHLTDAMRYALETESQSKIATTASRAGLGL